MATKGKIRSRYGDPANYDGKYPPDWDARRDTVYERDNYTCQRCGTRSGPHAGGRGTPLHAHHATPLSEGGTNDLDNLVTLCESCHDEVHEHDITEGLGPDRGVVGRLLHRVRLLLWYIFSLPAVFMAGGIYLWAIDGLLNGVEDFEVISHTIDAGLVAGGVLAATAVLSLLYPVVALLFFATFAVMMVAVGWTGVLHDGGGGGLGHVLTFHMAAELLPAVVPAAILFVLLRKGLLSRRYGT